MSVNKLIKFYTLTPTPCLTLNGITNASSSNQVHSLFKSAFPTSDFYTLDFNKKTLFFDIKEYDCNHMFGICSVEEKISATNFMLQRNRQTHITTPFVTIDNDEQLESYTFFYIDFIHQKMAVIAHKKISKIHDALSQFIWEKSGNMSKIQILPESITDVEKEANKLLDPSWLELSYSSPIMIEECASNLMETLGDDFKPLKLNIKVKLEKPNSKLEFIRKLIKLSAKNNSNNNPNQPSALKLIGKNELGLEETFNFLETIYTKTVPLKLTNDTSTNIDYIKKQLSYYLQQHLAELT